MKLIVSNLAMCFMLVLCPDSTGQVPLGLPALTEQSELIVVARVSAVSPTSGINMTDQSQSFMATLEPVRVVKGKSPSAISLPFMIRLNGPPGLSVGQYGLFFLRVQGNGRFVFADRMVPFLPASRVNSTKSGVDHLSAVIDVVGQTIQDTQQTLSERLRAIEVLGDASRSYALTYLRNCLGTTDGPIRLMCAAELLRNDDMSALPVVVDGLLASRGHIGRVRWKLISSIRQSVRGVDQLQTVTRLLASQDADVREAAVSSLVSMKSSSTLEPLRDALADPSRRVRYRSFMGLSLLLNQNAEVPDLSDYEMNEAKYLGRLKASLESRD